MSSATSRRFAAAEKLWTTLTILAVLASYYLTALPPDAKWTSDVANGFYGWQTDAYLKRLVPHGRAAASAARVAGPL
jgi:hypothetical protein